MPRKRSSGHQPSLRISISREMADMIATLMELDPEARFVPQSRLLMTLLESALAQRLAQLTGLPPDDADASQREVTDDNGTKHCPALPPSRPAP